MGERVVFMLCLCCAVLDWREVKGAAGAESKDISVQDRDKRWK